MNTLNEKRLEAENALHEYLRELSNHVDDWPEIDGESVDLENFTVTEFIAVVGGDWQRGTIITVDIEANMIADSVELDF